MAIIVYTIGSAIIFESISYLFKNLSLLSATEKNVEDFEHVMAYLNSQMEHCEDFKILKGTNWSVLLTDSTPVVAFEILGGKGVNTLRRLRAKEKLHFSDLKKKRFGLIYLNENFYGFNAIYQGKEKMEFARENTHLLFRMGKRWFYIM